jgi:hypothetical protein
VRLNLLRILYSICDSSQEQGDLLGRYGLLDAIRELENDPAILVRDMAGKLVKFSEQGDDLPGNGRRPMNRRRSTSTMSQGLIPSGSRPSSPQINRASQSKALYEGRETPRHPRNGLNISQSRVANGDGSSPALLGTGSNGPAAARRIPRMSHRLSHVGSLADISRSPNITTRAPPSVVNPRRRRQTDVDQEWS